jgi:putative transposase
MAVENIHSPIYSRKIRFYPTKDQKQLLHKCFGATRYIHNKGLDWIHKNPSGNYSHITLRQNCMSSDKTISDEEKWLSDIPYDTRQLSLKQLASNMKTNFTLLKRGHIQFFEMKYKSKKNPSQTCFINKKAFNKGSLRLFPTRLNEPLSLGRKRNKKRWKREIQNIECDFVITKQGDKFYLCIPQEHPPTVRRKPQNDLVSLDPGVRSFQTFYSDKNAGKLGDQTIKQLFHIHQRVDFITSVITKSNGRTKRNLKQRCSLLRTKIKNIVDDLHWKTIHFLCSNFTHILLPSFGVKGMTRKKSRKINRKTTRNMLSLSHFRFKERLSYMSGICGNKLYIVGEEYTSQTCGGCGTRKKIGGSKHYSCKNCGFELDRDYNGARNILMKHLDPMLGQTHLAGSSH